MNTTIDRALAGLPPATTTRSGSVFYSGRGAFAGTRDLYVLGLNPGGDPAAQANETIAVDLADWQTLPERWSAYLDESWQGAAPGTWGMQPRMRHLFDAIGRDLRDTPASNVVFVRSRGEAALAREKSKLLAECWPVHVAVLETLGTRTILCLGGTAGRWVREAIGANTPLCPPWREQNGRGWSAEAHVAIDGRAVITVPHPGRADWRNPLADPSAFVRSALAR